MLNAKGIAAGLAAVIALLAPQAAQAEWLRAETRNFVVYSNGSEQNLREFATSLERFDGLLRSRTGRPQAEGLRKLPVYLVGDAAELRTLRPGLREGVSGFYSATSQDIRAALVRGENDNVLLHEYAHHFMFQNFPGGYPGWFTEGFAEFFMTATVDGRGRSTFGYPRSGRMNTLRRESWIPMEQFLRARPLEFERREQRAAFYAQSWLLTHYLLSDRDRMQRLDGYLRDVQAGVDPVVALNQHFQKTPQMLEREMRAYLNGRLTYAELNLPAAEVEMAVSRLPASADDLMLIGLDIQDGAPSSEGPRLLEQVRAAAARHPDDVLALTVLGRAEILWGDANTGEAALQKVLAADPDNVEALLLIARRRIATADTANDPAARLAGYREARGLLSRAFQADDTDYRVLELLASSRRISPDYPTANDLETWRLAVAHAPQVLSLREQAADAMIRAGQTEEGMLLLLPIASDPHNSDRARRARERLDTLRAGATGATTPVPAS
ncbi:MAG: DUF1570 domain-containing protein [Brevundimonas sp.]|nr:DUF1570 domain-containing protein [Brevundimonas sp.]